MNNHDSYLIINPEDSLEAGNIIIVLFGLPGVGKTSLSFTANNPLNLDFDGGLGRAVKRKRTVQFKSWNGYLQFVRDGHLAKVRGGTLICDTAKSMLDDFIGAHVVANNHKNGKKGGGISQLGFGAMKEIFAEFIREAKNYDVDLVFIAHAIGRENGESTILVPAMTGGSYEILVGKADLIGFMETRNNQAIIEFSPTDSHIGKNSAEFPVIKVPHYTDPKYDGFLGRLIEAAKEKRSRMTEEQADAVKLSDDVRRDIDSALSVIVLKETLTRVEMLPDNYVKAIAEAFNRRYVKLFRETNLLPANTADELSVLVLGLGSVPEVVGGYELRKACKSYIVEKAKAQNFEWHKVDQKYILSNKQASA